MAGGTGKMKRNGAANGEMVPLMTPWKPDEGDPKQHRNCWHAFFSWMKHSLIPGFLFTLTSTTFMLGYHSYPHVLITVACFLILAFLSDTVYQQKRSNGMSKHAFGFAVCAFAVGAGGVVGTAIHLTELLDYWPYDQKRHYTNVAPDEPAASKADASVIVFMEGARPDISKQLGYRRTGHTYCVAPIDLKDDYAATGDDASATVSDIQYWAVGVDCCDGHEGFTCDDAEHPEARAGLVMQKLEGDDLIGEGLMSSDVMNYYEKAVKMSMSKFDLTSPDERLYVRFVHDIDKARNGYWNLAWKHWMIYQCIWGLVWLSAGAMTVMMGANSGSGDPESYAQHIVDARQGALHKLNHYI